MNVAPRLAASGGFEGFGPSAVHLQTDQSGRCDARGPRPDVRAALRTACPASPGVYGIVSPQSRLIYVGYSTKLRQRLLSYFTGKRRGEKEHRIGRHAAHIHWEVVGHDFPAQLRELELIQRFAPDFNVKGRRRSREPGFLYLTDGEAPHFRFSIRVPTRAKRVWGPLPNLPSLRTAADQLNLMLQLRDCPSQVRMSFADETRVFETRLEPQCLRGEIGTCLAPCAGLCSRRAYHAQVRRAVQLLDGLNAAPLDDVQIEMQTASARMQFERAARLRDAADSVTELCRSLEQLRRPPEPKEGVYEVQTVDRPLWFLIGDGLLWGMQPKPASVPEARTTLEALRRLSGDNADPLTSLTRDSRRLLRSWFRNHPEELSAIHPLTAAREFCKHLLKPTRRRA